MGDWYSIGVALGVAFGLALVLAGVLGVNAVGVTASLVLGTALGVAVGLVVDDTEELVSGAVGGLLGAATAAIVVRGARRRGGTHLGVATYVGAAGILVALLALIPVVGYVVAVALPALALRMRGRAAARYAGLRTLAR